MITVLIDPKFIDQVFQTGYTTAGCLRVVHGIPKGAQLINLRWNDQAQLVELHFSDPEPGPNRMIEVSIRREAT